MINQLSKPTGCLVLAATALLAGCGGGNDDSGGPSKAASATTQVPAEALESVEGLAAFQRSLNRNATDDTSAPLVLGDAKLPTTDTAGPRPVN